MTQSNQSHRELILATPTQLLIQQPEIASVNKRERQAVLTFIEYLDGFHQELSERRFDIPFDTGMYRLDEKMFCASLAQLTYLFYTTLRKKTIVDLGKKPMQDWQINYFLNGISSYLGFYNLFLCLLSMLYESPNRLLEPFSEAQWQELIETTVSAMIDRKNFRDDYNGHPTELQTTSFVYKYRTDLYTYGWYKTYQKGSEEAKQAAQTIVQGELVRFRLFFEVLQGTLRFLDSYSKQPTSIEVNPPEHLNQYRNMQYTVQTESVTHDISEIKTLLNHLLDIDSDRQDGISQEREVNIIESNPLQAVEDTEEAISTEQDIPNDVIAWLLADKRQPKHPSISSFADMYLKRLVAASKEKVTHSKDGVTALPRWKSPEGGSYGYNPTDIAFHLSKLNSLLSKVTHGKQTKDIRLDGEMLLAFSTLLGFYNLCRFFLSCQQWYITHKHLLDKNNDLFIASGYKVTTAKWIDNACDLLKPFPEIESWSDENSAFYGWGRYNIVYYRNAPDLPYWCVEHCDGGQTASVIEWDEYRRLVDFLKSLRMLCTTLVGYNKSLSNTEEEQTESEWVTEAADLIHEIAGTVITLSHKDAALVLYTTAKHNGKKVKVTTAHGLEAVAYVVERKVGEKSESAAIFPRLPLRDGITETVVVHCDTLNVGDDNTLTLFAGNVTEAFLEE